MKRIGSLLSRCLPFGVACLAVAVAAQVSKTVALSFTKEGDREVWIGLTASPGDYVRPQSAQGTGITLDVPEKPEGLSVFVHDKASGNVAVKALSEVVRTGTWQVTPKDETLVRQMEFLVTYDAKPVASAIVRAKSGAQSRVALLSPADNGRATLYNLPPGPVQVTVEYKSEGQPKSTSAQTFEAKLGAGPSKPKAIAVTDKVETVAEPAPTASDEVAKGASEPTKEPAQTVAPAPNPAVTFLNLLLGVALVGGISYGIYTYIKKNPKQFEDTLKKVGIGPVEPPVDDVPPPPSQPQPIKPIMLDDATPTAVAGPVSSVATAVRTPRLVKGDGSVVLLGSGENVVGREEGLTVSLAGESSVSRHHARLEMVGDDVQLSDLGSTNGTFLNGAKLTGAATLKPGDSVQFGAVAFRFEV